MFNNIFNIKPQNKFLQAVAKWVLEQIKNDGELVNLTILLPSRRAARELKKEFLSLSENEALILPKILAIGDVDYDDIYTTSIPEAMIQNNIEYKIELIKAIKDWNDKTDLFGKNISSSALASIAENLKNFLDEVEKEGIDLEKLKKIDDSELASHKQKILEFLQHFSFVWKNSMLKKGIVSHAEKQNLMIKNYDDFLKKNGSPYPIIAAGSTGSVKTTKDLLKTISKLPNGKVVLFGLDKNLEEKIWNKIDESHPQFALKKLLENLEVKRSQITEVGNNENDIMEDLCRLAMLPAEFSNEWQKGLGNNLNSEWIATSQAPRNDDVISLDNKSLAPSLRAEGAAIQKSNKMIECKNEFEEAKIIALLMRETLEEKNKTAALISNNKVLINLVKDNLSKWQIKIDDSKSSNLSESAIANYLFLISDFAATQFDVVKLLGILKHPLFFNEAHLLEVLEVKILRNVAKFSSFEDLILKAKDHPKLKEFLIKISGIFEKLIKEFKKDKIDFKKAWELHFQCFENLSLIVIPGLTRNPETLDKERLDSRLRGNDKVGGILELEEFITDIKNTKADLRLEPQSYNPILQNFLQNYQYRKNDSFHPRLHILSTMEARLMNHDLTIVSGLVEGEFPSGSSDHFLGAKLRSDLGLASQNKKIGIAAYDFCNYLQSGNIVLLAPKNQNNTPSIKSRFLLKIATILKINNLNYLFKNGAEYLKFLAEEQNIKLEKSDKIAFIPTEKLKKFSATDISKWLRNPYYIYAKRILKLKPLKEIEASASFAEFGNFVHKALEEFIKNYPNGDLIKNGKEIFPNYFPDPSSQLLWWPKFENIADWFLKNEEKLRADLKEVLVEVEAQIMIKNVLLTTKIDRINLYKDGRMEIIDYKTGSLPQDKEIRSGLEPQLAIEAVILSQGKINNYSLSSEKNIENLQYQNLKGRDKNLTKDLKNSAELINAAADGINRLIEIFNDQKIGYIIAPDLDLYKKDDYWHLGRVDN